MSCREIVVSGCIVRSPGRVVSVSQQGEQLRPHVHRRTPSPVAVNRAVAENTSGRPAFGLVSTLAAMLMDDRHEDVEHVGVRAKGRHILAFFECFLSVLLGLAVG